MLSTPEQQGSFYDVSYVCEQLIPQNSFYRKFREVVNPLIEDRDFESMYSMDNGRPPISPAFLAKAMIIQFYKNYSDREMERACMYDIEIKYALGLRLDERAFDHSSLGDFRKRLLKNNKEKEVFDRVLNQLVDQKLIKRDEIQRVDATHVIADVAIPTMVTLVKKGTREVLKSLKGQKKNIYQKLVKEISVEEYTKETVNKDAEGRLNIENRQKKLVEVVEDARKVLKETRGVKCSSGLRKRIELLQRILQENIEDDEEGKVKEKGYKQKPKDILVSPIDEDARYGAKSKTKRFMGYKAEMTESVGNRLITNIKAMRGNCRDGRETVGLVVNQKKNQLLPKKLVGDAAYSDGMNRKMLKDNETKMIAPLRQTNQRSKEIYPKSMFQYNEQALTLTCPQGVTTRISYQDRRHGLKQFHFPVTKCKVCPVQSECTNEKDGRRTVGITLFNKELREAEKYNVTQEFKEDMKLRPMIEGKFSEMKRYHGLRRARYRGLQKLDLQCYFTATAVNIKRWFNIMAEKFKPDKEIQYAL